MPRKIKEDALKGSYADKLIDAAVDIRMSPDAFERSYGPPACAMHPAA